MTQLDKRPIAVKSATSFFGFMIGDLLAQTITGHGAYDVFRTLRLVRLSTLHHSLATRYLVLVLQYACASPYILQIRPHLPLAGFACVGLALHARV